MMHGRKNIKSQESVLKL